MLGIESSGNVLGPKPGEEVSVFNDDRGHLGIPTEIP